MGCGSLCVLCGLFVCVVLVSNVFVCFVACGGVCALCCAVVWFVL